MASVNVYRGRLYLLGRFPRKDGSGGTAQQRIALRLDDTPVNQRIAARQLKRLEKQLADGSFTWDNWLIEGGSATRWRDAIQMLYRRKVVLGRTSEKTWSVSYMGILRQLDPTAHVTTQSIREAITRYSRDQATYKLIYYLMKDIAVLASIPFPEVAIPLYGKKLAAPIEVPSDEEIIDWVTRSGEPYRFFFGMMAAYGLRPHEIDTATMLDDGCVQVDSDTKTGFRTVIPLPPEWIDLFNLRDRTERPPSTRIEPRSDECSQWLNKRRLKLQIPYRTYALRHAYAARLWRLGGSELDLYTAAQLMGHSVQEHLDTYRSHIDPNRIAASARDAIARNMRRSTARSGSDPESAG